MVVWNLCKLHVVSYVIWYGLSKVYCCCFCLFVGFKVAWGKTGIAKGSNFAGTNRQTRF